MPDFRTILPVVAVFWIAVSTSARDACAALGDCGQPVSSADAPLASDALSVLHSAVGLVPCELCVCDADGSGIVTAPDALRVLSRAVGQDVSLDCPSCAIPREPEFELGSAAAAATTLVTPADGGEVMVAGAVLEIPPGTVQIEAAIGLVQIVAPPGFDEDAGSLGGQLPLSDDAFVLVSDRDVDLVGPIFLTLPFDSERLPEGALPGNIHVSTMNGGYTIALGPPDEVDLETGHLRFAITAESLARNLESMAALGPARPKGVVAAGIGARLLGVTTVVGTAVGVFATFVNPVRATVDDVNSLFGGFDKHDTEHFKIRFRGGGMDFGDAIRVGSTLEEAYALFVDDMGFHLPNFFDLDGRYTVYFDEFSNHSLIPDEADGFTLAGSGLFEGASYVNTLKNEDGWESTAVHEYFHALQYGALRSPLTVISLERAFAPESDWLFEGSAAALSGRVTAGGGTMPALDQSVGQTFEPLRSAYNPDQFPAADVAQDFFFFLEHEFGHVDFYRPMFERLGGVLPAPGDAPKSAVAVDEVLREMSDDEDRLGLAWLDFVYALTIDTPGIFSNLIGVEMVTLMPDASDPTAEPEETTSLAMEPMSFAVVDYTIPPLDAGTPDEQEPVDLELKVRVTAASDVTLLRFDLDTASPPPDFPERFFVDGVGVDKVVRIEGTRGAASRRVRLVVTNPGLESDDAVALQIDAALRVAPEKVDLSGVITTVTDFRVHATLQQTLPDGTMSTSSNDFPVIDTLPGGVVGTLLEFDCSVTSSGMTTSSSIVGTVSDTGDRIESLVYTRDVESETDFASFLLMQASSIPLAADNPTTASYRVTGAQVCDYIQNLEYTVTSSVTLELLDFSCDETSILTVRLKRDDPVEGCQ